MTALAIEPHTRRGRLRDSRSRSLGTKLTLAEEKEMTRAATEVGKSASEWAREVLLREARRSEDPLFIELIATRMVLLNLLKPLAMGKIVTPEDFTRISASVRSDKRKIAHEIQQQYIAVVPKE
jgi:hypothetical protein